ncbi:chromosome segregation protein SMC [Nesterenkonia sandarakina]|uniref:Chromosome partition protein Smc n=1 Tax=Nesterenkonia sandarakina TaxID=272918 RepID=A0A2T0YSW8_9MICC|nr:chromosome segregation protein SMC [Nesterenkonia sandarakina]PRZ18886.1 condensin subunit Smc [Nesterenkonia sandarakina]
MHLKTLTVRGFKSFASATTFEFEPGVTAVVGPNGSGKSNVVDALAWVMGEQGAKSLRGGTMEDVIFAGTTERQPLGRASVSLTIDNSDGALPIEYSEVTISRTMFRAGGSDYTINGAKCRLLDIQELLSDSGLGREMHVIVGQGQLDQILQATPEQRRGFIEEAAGVLKHRRRRERSVRKLESMQTNLSRLEDLISEISRQLAPLGRQARVARRAQRIQHDLRDSLSRLIADDLVRAATALNESSQGEAEDREQAEQLRAWLAAQDAEITQLEQQAADQRAHAEKLLAGHHRLEQVQERLRSVASLAEERARSLHASAVVQQTGRDPEALRAQAQSVAEQAAELDAEVTAARDRLERSSAERAAAEDALKLEETRLTEQLRAVADRRAGLATLRGRVDTAQGRIDAAESRRRRAQEQGDAARTAQQRARGEFAELEQRVAGVETGEEDLDVAYEAAHQRLEALRSAYDEQRTQQQRLRTAISEHRARLSGLSAARTPRDGAAALLRDRAADVEAPLAQRLRVTRGWETAIAACLGSLDAALIVKDAETAAQALDWLAAQDAGRAHLIHPVAAESAPTRQQTASEHAAPAPSAPESSARAQPAGELPDGAMWAQLVVSVTEDVEVPVHAALTGVVLCADQHQAAALLERPEVRCVVTADGVVLRAGEQIGGTVLENSDVAITAQITELTETLRQAELELHELTAVAAADESEVNAAELKVEETLQALHANDAEMHATTEQLGRLHAELERSAERIEHSDQEIREAQESAVEAQHLLEEAQSRLQAAQSEDIEEEPSSVDRDRLSAAATAQRREEVDARLELRAAEEQHKQMLERAAALRRSAAAEEARREEARKVAQARSSRAAQAEAVQAEAETAVHALTAVLDRSQRTRAAAETAGTATGERVRTLRAARKTEAAELEALTAALHQAELTRTELRLSLEAAEARGLEELSLTPEYLIEHYGPDQLVPDAETVRSVERPDPAEPAASAESGEAGEPGVSDDAAFTTDTADAPESGVPFDRSEQEKRLAQARRDLKALGKVNPLALEEHSALAERHTYLQDQLADLKKSRQDLLDIIADVDATVEKVFTEAWLDTKVQFERVFARLFPGGEGRLELTNPEDMLNTGIEVQARPPGKRIRRLSLLSGGERSLTAVALLVAIFKARPSPFYVMDEVEAALDDTNLSRLLVIFEELRESSQLIIITHQKRTMEIADALYGVSMRQDGSTRVVSQRLAATQELTTAELTTP